MQYSAKFNQVWLFLQIHRKCLKSPKYASVNGCWIHGYYTNQSCSKYQIRGTVVELIDKTKIQQYIDETYIDDIVRNVFLKSFTNGWERTLARSFTKTSFKRTEQDLIYKNRLVFSNVRVRVNTFFKKTKRPRVLLSASFVPVYYIILATFMKIFRQKYRRYRERSKKSQPKKHDLHFSKKDFKLSSWFSNEKEVKNFWRWDLGRRKTSNTTSRYLTQAKSTFNLDP